MRTVPQAKSQRSDTLENDTFAVLFSTLESKEKAPCNPLVVSGRLKRWRKPGGGVSRIG